MTLRRNDLTENRNSLATDLKIKKAVSLGCWQLVVYETKQLCDEQVESIVEDIIPASCEI